MVMIKMTMTIRVVVRNKSWPVFLKRDAIHSLAGRLNWNTYAYQGDTITLLQEMVMLLLKDATPLFGAARWRMELSGMSNRR
jgi:hypothetical protein